MCCQLVSLRSATAALIKDTLLQDVCRTCSLRTRRRDQINSNWAITMCTNRFKAIGEKWKRHVLQCLSWLTVTSLVSLHQHLLRDCHDCSDTVFQWWAMIYNRRSHRNVSTGYTQPSIWMTSKEDEMKRRHIQTIVHTSVIVARPLYCGTYHLFKPNLKPWCSTHIMPYSH